jgi:hypothetical protein
MDVLAHVVPININMAIAVAATLICRLNEIPESDDTM